MKSKLVTLYIDDASIRVAVINGKRVKKWADCPLEPGLVKGSAIINEAEVASRIRQLFQAQKIDTKKVVLGFSGLHSMTRPVVFPSLPKAMQAEAVMRMAKKALPIPVEQLYISWQLIPAPQGKMQAFLAGTPRKTADSLVKTVRQAGLEPVQMALKPLALVRAVKEPSAIILDVQPAEFDIVIVADGVPHPIRTVSLPADALSWQDKLPLIISDLERTISFYNSNNQDKSLEPGVPIYVSGELANAPEHHKAVSDALGHPVVVMSSPVMSPPELDLGRYMVNAVLAFKGLLSRRELGSSAAGLSVLPARYQPKPVPVQKLAILPAAGVLIMLIVALAMLLQTISANTGSVGSELATIEGMIKRRASQQQELKKSVAEIEKTVSSARSSGNALSGALSTLDRRRNEVSGNLKLSLSVLPGGVSLTGLSHVDNKLTVSGRASSEEEVLSYARALDTTGKFSETVITSMKRVSGDRIEFVIVLKVKE
ncbi:MAG: pilus assembly protein PilM [Dehalococcoidia bacterium]|nr:pilus assembly protein PilM [Dehalococcoidia bacterium]